MATENFGLDVGELFPMLKYLETELPSEYVAWVNIDSAGVEIRLSKEAGGTVHHTAAKRSWAELRASRNGAATVLRECAIYTRARLDYYALHGSVSR